MTDTFRCGHPRTAENSVAVGKGCVACRICRNTRSALGRERARARAAGKLAHKSQFTPIALPPELQEPPALSPEALGSRLLLQAYARYYEKHVRGEAA